ncbi:diguanylate cyclase [Aquisalimonas lutea]|uniref:GGDEF domain-containing protein n=1 Tax=Aquisalimonas lutea TaxID=1327750 RepID=UPI0025B5D3ED|nr:GGDEF domain-containing protein [Aquisalimonas lutea]MDN3519233.1 diguanylate cyclase [Aquisalimonas lutea]
MTDELEQLHEAVRRAALRLIRAGRGRTPDMDRALEELRRALIDDTDAARIGSAAEELGAALLTLDDAPEPPAAVPPGPEPAGTSAPEPPRSLLRRLRRLGRTNPDRQETNGHVMAIRQRLTAMADALALPAPYKQKLRDARNELESAETPDALATRVDRMVDVLVAANRDESAELEAFFLQLSQRLGDLHALLRSDEASEEDADADEARLDSAVQTRVQSIQTALRDTRDSRQAHRLISADLDTLVREVATYRETRDVRRRKTRERNEALRVRLQEAQEESARLRSALAHEQQRAAEDHLTGIGNREAHEKRLADEMTRGARTGTPVSLMVIDVDAFKPVNDRYGHSAGDDLLARLAALLQESVRTNDFLARYGGEEFTLVLPGTPLAQACTLAEHLREAVATTPMDTEAGALTVTVSIGVAEAGNGEAPESLFRRADRALYRAKGAGRNRVAADG